MNDRFRDFAESVSLLHWNWVAKLQSRNRENTFTGLLVLFTDLFV